MQPKISFAKMHGLGNDFVVINAISQSLAELPVKQLANRHLGIGFDQLLIIKPAANADFYCQIFNADGSEAEQCGNGLRCVARFIHEDQLFSGNSFTIETKAGIFPIYIKNYNQITVSLALPDIKETAVEFTLNEFGKIKADILSLGNPHAIIQVPDIESVAVEQAGFELAKHDYFKRGVNVGFLQVINSNHILLRTCERGVGETHACGSNACAAAYAGIVAGWLKSPVNVEFRYGSLIITFNQEKECLEMTGPATRVFNGEY